MVTPKGTSFKASPSSPANLVLGLPNAVIGTDQQRVKCSGEGQRETRPTSARAAPLTSSRSHLQNLKRPC